MTLYEDERGLQTFFAIGTINSVDFIGGESPLIL